MASSGSDLKAHATSNIDFYTLLELSPTFGQKDLDRAWRKTAFKYHPDKVGAADAAAREQFHLANVAYDILSDPSLRQLYDDACRAREHRRQQDELLQGKRRKMKEDLESRERAAAPGTVSENTMAGAKRAGDEAFDEEERLEREIQRIAADGKRRRLEREEAIRREMIRQQEEVEKEKREKDELAKAKAAQQKQGVPELERSVTASFIRTPENEGIDAPAIQAMFSEFGGVETVRLLKDKRKRREEHEGKVTIGKALIVFKSIVGAYSAVEDWAKEVLNQGAWAAFETVFWAEGKEPEYITSLSTSAISTRNRSFGKSLSGGSTPQTTSVATTNDGGDFQKPPSFASFSLAAKKATQPLAPVGGRPTLEEMTMIRLRLAEKRRLEAEKRDAGS